MFTLQYQSKHGVVEYYMGMICGMIVQISASEKEAKPFKTEEQAIKERDEFHAYLNTFKVVKLGAQ